MVDRSFHDGLVVIDGLQYSAWDRATLEELRAGGLSAAHVTLAYWEDARATLRLIGDWHRRSERVDDLLLGRREVVGRGQEAVAVPADHRRRSRGHRSSDGRTRL